MSLTVDTSSFLQRHAAASQHRRRISFDAVAYIAALVDMITITASSVAAVFLYHQLKFGLLDDPSWNIGLGVLTTVIFVLSMASLRAYSHESLSSLGRQFLLILLLFPVIIALVLAIFFFLKLSDTFSRGAVLHLALMSMAVMTGTRIAYVRWLLPSLAGGLLRRRKALWICPQDMSPERIQQLSEMGPSHATAVAFLADDEASRASLSQRLCNVGARENVDEIVVIWREGDSASLNELLSRLGQPPVPVTVVFDNTAGCVASCPRVKFGNLAAFQVQSAPLGLAERAIKRGFDLTFAATALVLLSPMLLLVAIAIKLDSPGPVFFFQRRLGRGNEQFSIVKFRSMRVLEDGPTVRQATRGDARITRVGAFIRATSIDELPQFWNVLRGEMSVVGPRPHAVAHDEFFDTLIAEYASRRHVKPGITGWAQVNGSRGETPTVDLMEQRVRHDRWYIDNWSLWFDMKIIIRTFFALRGH